MSRNVREHANQKGISLVMRTSFYIPNCNMFNDVPLLQRKRMRVEQGPTTQDNTHTHTQVFCLVPASW